MTIENKTALIQDDSGLFVPVHDPRTYLDVTQIKRIRSSPYFEDTHSLSLDTLTPSYQIVSLALQSFRPLDISKYAYLPYHDAFNLDELLKLIKVYSRQSNVEFPETTVYVIAFRSILHPHVQYSAEKRQYLAAVDNASHLEANQSGGLLKYWFGTPDDIHGKNLATCWWTDKQLAVLGGGGQAHRLGMNKVRGWFKHWQVEEYHFTIEQNATGYSWMKL